MPYCVDFSSEFFPKCASQEKNHGQLQHPEWRPGGWWDGSRRWAGVGESVFIPVLSLFLSFSVSSPSFFLSFSVSFSFSPLSLSLSIALSHSFSLPLSVFLSFFFLVSLSFSVFIYCISRYFIGDLILALLAIEALQLAKIVYC